MDKPATMLGFLDPRLKLPLMLGAALVVAVLVGVLAVESQGPSFMPLFTDLESKDAADVVARLEEQKVPYRLTAGGRTIDVPEKDVYRTRLTLAQEGLPRSGVVGLEIMDKVNLGATDFDKRVQYLRAIQGELTRTIMQIDGVKAARVHLNIPEPSLFVRDRQPASAAILLELRPGTRLDGAQVRGIAHLVAGSVEGLKPEQVTVLDQNGQIVSGEQGNGPEGASAGGNLAMQDGFQKKLQQSVQSMLEQVLGMGNVATRVNAELSFDQQTVERELFQPIRNDEGILRSIDELSETMNGTTPGGGVTGVDANTQVPTYQAAGQNGNSSFQKSHTVRNFEINKIREQVAIAPGAVKRLSVSVVVNRKLTPEQQDSIAGVVTAAVGLDSTRRDLINVIGLPFNNTLAEELKKSQGVPVEGSKVKEDGLVRTLVLVGAGVALLGAFALALLAGRRRVAKEKVRLAAELMELQRQTVKEQPKRPATQPIEESPVTQLQQQVVTLAKQKPEEVAQIIRSWLVEN